MNSNSLPDLSTYKRWLAKEGYQPTTIELTLQHLGVLAITRYPGMPRRVPHARRYLRFVESTGKNPMGDAFVQHLRDAGITAAVDRVRSGKRTRKALTPEQWSKLRTALRKDGSHAAKLVIAYVYSSRRISAFLQLNTRFAADASFIDDAPSRRWIADHAVGTVPLYKFLAMTEHGAHIRMLRKLHTCASKVGLDVDLDSLSRTVLN